MEDSDSGSKNTHKRSGSGDNIETKKKKMNYGYLIKILIGNELAGVVLGKGGETILSLQKQTDSTITLSKTNVYFPGTLDRICIISGGTDEAVRNAFHKIVDTISQHTTINTIRFIVPDGATELLFENEDSCIKHFRDASDISIKLSDKIETLTEQVVTVTGSYEKVLQVCDKIINTIFSTPSIISSLAVKRHHLEHMNYPNDVLSQKNNLTRSCIKLLIPNKLVGYVMGKGGEIVASIQKSTDCRIVVSKETKYYPGTTDRICLITGLSEESISNALRIVLEYTFKRHDHDSEVEVKLLIPNSVAGLVIGKEGAMVKSLRDIHDVSVQLSKKSDVLSERVVSISGILQSAYAACKKIISTICTNHSVLENNRIDYDDMILPVATYQNSSIGTIPDHFKNNRGYGTSPVLSKFPFKFHLNGDGNPCTIPFDIYSDLLYSLTSDGYTDGAVGEIYASLSTLAKYGIITTDNTSSSSQSPSRYSVDASSVDAFKRLVKMEIQIPSFKVGAIIGNGGRTLVDIEQQTKTKIQISKKGDFAPGTTNRTVSIYGADSDVEQAKRLIYFNLDAADLRYNRQY